MHVDNSPFVLLDEFSVLKPVWVKNPCRTLKGCWLFNRPRAHSQDITFRTLTKPLCSEAI